MPTPLLRPATARPAFRRSLGLLGGAALLSLAAHTADAQVVFGLSGSDLTSVNLASPFTSQTRVAITGVTVGQTLVGLDFRPATGELYALGYNVALSTANAQLYVINQTTAAATPVGAVMSLALGGSTERIAFDFNPTVDRIRVASTNDTNYRLNPTTGAVTIDTNLAFVAGDANAGQNPYVGAAGYTNSFIGAASTTLYYIDEQRSLLLRSDTPNGGTLATVATLNPQAAGNPAPINAPGASTDLDIYTFGPNDQQAYLNVNQVQGGSFVSLLYRVNLSSGATTLSGAINGTGVGITDIAVRIDRTAPAPSGQLLYAVNTNNTLLSFYSGTPAYINSAVPLSGITAGQTLVGTDFRPNTGQLFGFGYDPATAGANSQLYTIDPASGVTTAVGPAIRLELGDATNNIGFDFNPTVDRIRVVSTNRADYRLNPNNGALAATDGQLTYAAGDVNDGTAPRVGSVAYLNSYPGSTGTVLYDIDEALSVVASQSPPNNGTLNTLGTTAGVTLDPSNALVDLDIYFDRSALSNQAFLTANPGGQNTSNLYTMSLGTSGGAFGTTTLVGAIGLGIPVRDISAQLAGADASAALTGRLLYGVAGGNLVSFDSGNPTVIRTAVNITGLPADGSQVLVGTDFRPATGVLYALGYNAATQQGQLYTLNLTSGALTAVGGLTSMGLGSSAASIGFDFNPVADRIRITAGTTQANLRMNPADGTFVTDTPLTGVGALTGVAYTNNDNNAATGTIIYGIDQSGSLVTSAAPNGGSYTSVGSLGVSLNPAQGADFDIYSDLLANSANPPSSAFLATSPTGTTTDNLYAVNLGTGAASLLGRVGSGTNLTGLAAFLTPGPVLPAGLTWTGAVSTDWGTAGNWSPAQVPSLTDDVTIPNVANDPVVSGNQAANNLTLGSGATLTFNSGVLALNGSLTNNGGTTQGPGAVNFQGAAGQSVTGTTTTLYNVVVGTNGLTAAGPLRVQRELFLNGNLASNGNLTLLSDATGTAQVLSLGGFTVTGTATVQRYIDPSLNPGPGYRHFSAPVRNTTVADLATGGFTPVVNPAYNTAPVPNQVTPFPTVFGYDQARVTTSGNPAPQDFDKGFFSPASVADSMTVGRGYTVNISAGLTPDFVGRLNNGNIAVGGLARGTQAESGWQLLGNPYPGALNWDLVSRSNVDAAVYVYRSTGPYAGTYSSYVANGVGANGGSNVIGTGQGFFVRVSTPGTANGQVAFANSMRFNTYQSPVFQRATTVTGPLVRLALQAASGPADETVVYLEPGATAGFDAALDAYKLLAGGAPLLASPLDATTRLSVNALPPLTAAAPERVIPLHVQGLQAGAYTLRAAELLNLPAGTYAYLRDADTGAVVDLQAQPSYAFTLANTALTTRFSLVLTQNRVLATAPVALDQQVGLYPNPARTQVTLQLPASLAQQPVAVSVLNALGQQVLTRVLPAGRPAEGALTLPLTGLAKGVYSVRLTTPQGLVTKRLVVE
ncbi:DUF4394 domain-containing protein [Hymenobacter sp. 15J16-1T3B]|uniref:DUF4394 domain-containing protein n=1 Tax=Hymenobacter sp. 15J16-1T3B TaxID=2886941 RepID=UPI001D11B9EF|nr:DUF4394 domain-containing protein [Hymenobacter sp. 15J16-1T3B]MCC3159868.1 DUF4394 domain-containing protein [Hymenobacter sp. 15J16-1T3B]